MFGNTSRLLKTDCDAAAVMLTMGTGFCVSALVLGIGTCDAGWSVLPPIDVLTGMTLASRKSCSKSIVVYELPVG